MNRALTLRFAAAMVALDGVQFLMQAVIDTADGKGWHAAFRAGAAIGAAYLTAEVWKAA